MVAEPTPVEARAPSKEGRPVQSGGCVVCRKPTGAWGPARQSQGMVRPGLTWPRLVVEDSGRLEVNHGREGRGPWGDPHSAPADPPADRLHLTASALAFQVRLTLNTSKSRRRASLEEGKYIFRSCFVGGPESGRLRRVGKAFVFGLGFLLSLVLVLRSEQS